MHLRMETNFVYRELNVGTREVEQCHKFHQKIFSINETGDERNIKMWIHWKYFAAGKIFWNSYRQNFILQVFLTAAHYSW